MATYCGHMSDTREPSELMDLARQCRKLIDDARAAGVTVDDGNVVDLCADHLTAVPLFEIRCALACSGYGAQFPRATAAQS